MLMYYDPDRYIPDVRWTVCGYHKQHPGKSFAGCTCCTVMSTREATPEEYRERRHARLAERREELEKELARINAELAA